MLLATIKRVSSWFFILCVFTLTALGQGVTTIGNSSIAGKVAVLGTPVPNPGPFNFTLFDFGQCTNGSAPTTTCLGNSTYPSLPSGASFTVTNTNTDVTASNTENYNWPTFTLTGGSWPNNSTLSLELALGTAGDGISFTYPSSTVEGTVSACAPIYTTWPQNGGATSRVDLWSNDTTGTPSTFLNAQLVGAVSTLQMNSECAPAGGNCTGGEFTNGTFSTGTWQIMCHSVTVGSSGSEYQALWSTPQNGGGLVANTLVSNTGSFTTGKNEVHTYEIGTNGGLSTYAVYSGAQVYCGLISSQTACGFPLVPGLQLIAPTMSPGSGNYTSTQTVTISNVSPVTDNYYYTTCSTAGCTPSTPTTASTLVSGTISVTPPEAVSAISARAAPYNNPISAVTTADYASPNASYVNSGSCVATATASCTITLSVSSGNIIAACSTAGSSSNTLTYSDSHSDTPSYTTTVTETTDNNRFRCGMMVAGAAVTTITCTQSVTSQDLECLAASYSPGTLSGTLDTSTGIEQENTSSFASGTVTPAGSSDLLIGFWATGSTGITATNTDGSTQRITIGSNVSGALSDRTGWGTAAQGATYTLSNSAYGAAIIMAIK